MSPLEATPVSGKKPDMATAKDKNRIPDAWLTVLSVTIAVYHLLFVSTLLPRFGLLLMNQQHRAISLGSLLLLTFLTHGARKGKTAGRLPWYDYLFIAASVVPTAYYALFYSKLQEYAELGFATATEVILCFFLLAAIFEAGRRVIGLAMIFVAFFFLVHALFASHFPGLLFGRAISLERLAVGLYIGANGIFGFPVEISATVIITFIILSQLLLEAGASRFYLDLTLSLVGHLRGGPAKVAVVASSLFATLSGSITANVAATGSITIPLMKRSGFEPHFAGAVEAVASKGGQLTPPIMGAVAFLMAEFTGYNYLQICIAAALPAVLYYISIFLQVDFRAARLGLMGLPRSELPSLRETLKEGWHYLITLAALVALIMRFRHLPEMAAFYSMIVLWAVSLFRKESRLGTRRIVAGLKSGVCTTLYAAIPCAVAGIILASLSATGLGLRFSLQVTNLAGENLAALVGLAALASFVMGMGMSSIAIYVILSVLIAPSLVKMGVHILAAHLFIIYWGNVSFITPPVAVAAFVAAGIAGADAMKTGWQACRLGIVSFVIPLLFIWNPNLIMVGSPGDILLAVISALIGVALLAGGVEGYLLGATVNWVVRVILIGSACLMLAPGLTTDLIGLAIAAPLILWRIRGLRQVRLGR